MKINMCKSYTEQIKHKKEFFGKSLDINLSLLKGKILPSCICLASIFLPTPKHFENSNLNIVKCCEVLYVFQR